MIFEDSYPVVFFIFAVISYFDRKKIGNSWVTFVCSFVICAQIWLAALFIRGVLLS